LAYIEKAGQRKVRNVDSGHRPPLLPGIESKPESEFPHQTKLAGRKLTSDRFDQKESHHGI